MAIITERLNANKPQPTEAQKNKAAVNNNKDLDVDAKKEETSFFGSFFAKGTATKKKGAAVMDAVCDTWDMCM